MDISEVYMRHPIRWFSHWADWFERRGVYVPSKEQHSLDTWRDFGWMIVMWLTALGLFILFFAMAT